MSAVRVPMIMSYSSLKFKFDPRMSAQKCSETTPSQGTGSGPEVFAALAKGIRRPVDLHKEFNGRTVAAAPLRNCLMGCVRAATGVSTGASRVCTQTSQNMNGGFGNIRELGATLLLIHDTFRSKDKLRSVKFG